MARLSGRGEGEGLARQIASAVGWLARKRSVSRDVAEEAVQEALFQLVELSARLQPRDGEGWLRRSAERRLMDMERHRQTQVPDSEPLEVGERIAGRPSMDDKLALRAGLRKLEPEVRKLVVLRLSGASWREVAKATGLEEEAARKRYELALGLLRDYMGDGGRA